MQDTEDFICYIRLIMGERCRNTGTGGSDRIFGLALWGVGTAPAVVFLDRVPCHRFATPPQAGAVGAVVIVALVIVRYAYGRTGAGVLRAPLYGLAALLPRIRRILRAYTWGSLLSLLPIRERVTEANAGALLNMGWLDGERLGGIAGYPILLGMLAGVALVIEVTPIRRARLWPLHTAVRSAPSPPPWGCLQPGTPRQPSCVSPSSRSPAPGLWAPTAPASVLICALLMLPTDATPLSPQERPLPWNSYRHLPSPASSA